MPWAVATMMVTEPPSHSLFPLLLPSAGAMAQMEATACSTIIACLIYGLSMSHKMQAILPANERWNTKGEMAVRCSAMPVSKQLCKSCLAGQTEGDD